MINKEQIIESERKLLSAMKNNDIKILDEMLHDDLLFVIPNGQLVTKEMDLNNFRSGNITFEAISSSDLQINMVDDNAISTQIFAIKGKYLENEFEGKFRYIRVWKLFNDRCKIIAGSGIQLS